LAAKVKSSKYLKRFFMTQKFKFNDIHTFPEAYDGMLQSLSLNII